MDTFLYKFDSENPFFRVGEFSRVSLSHHYANALYKRDTIASFQRRWSDSWFKGSNHTFLLHKTRLQGNYKKKSREGLICHGREWERARERARDTEPVASPSSSSQTKGFVRFNLFELFPQGLDEVGGLKGDADLHTARSDQKFRLKSG